MADWRSLAQKLALADERIELQDARILREELFGDGKIDKSSVNFLISLRRGAKSVAVEFDEAVFGIVKQVLLKNGAISPDQTKWLKGFLAANGSLRKHERAFLQDLIGLSDKHCPEFLDWCMSQGVSSTYVGSREAVPLPVALMVPTVIAVEEDEPITVIPIEPANEPSRRRKSTSHPGISKTLRNARASGMMGYLSLAVALFVYFGSFLLVMALAGKESRPAPNSSASVMQGFGILASLPIALIGLLAGIAGAWKPGHASRLCAILGIIFNGLVVLGCSCGLGGIIFLGMGARK